MYISMTRRTANRERQQETLQRGATDFFPKLQQAPGFLGFYLVAEDDGTNVAITHWESRAQAETFMAGTQGWRTTLEEHGHREASQSGGEVIHQVMPRT